LKVGSVGIRCRHDADGELWWRWYRLGHRVRRSQWGSRGVLSWLFCAAACVHAQSSVRCRASTTLCGFGTWGADVLSVQNGPETVGLDGGDAVSAVGLRLGGIMTFCCSLSRLAAVQGSSLIVSLPRAPGPPSKPPTPAIHLGRTVPISKQDIHSAERKRSPGTGHRFAQG
jgi:hypothetical protein